MSRLTYGPTPGLLQEVESMGVMAWIDQQLDPSSIDDSAVESILAGYRTLTATNQANWTTINAAPYERGDVLNELRHAAALRALTSKRQLQEVMVDFWTNHFSLYFSTDGGILNRHLKIRDEFEVQRPHALGRFEDMVLASAHSPAMLKYLDNATSNANSPQGVNENYGRELLELHTLGIINGQQVYGEADLRGVALVLSGWSVDVTDSRNTFVYRDSRHWRRPVDILGGAANGGWSTPGRSGEAGYQDGVDLIKWLAHHPSTARYIAYKLCVRFVSETPSEELINSAAAVFLANDTRIVPVLRHIFTSSEFAASKGTRFKRPVEYVFGMIRTLGSVVETDAFSTGAEQLRNLLGSVSQPLYGWQGPDGYAEKKDEWVSAAGMLRRWQAAGRLCNNSINGIMTNVVAMVPADRRTAGQVVDWLASRLVGQPLTSQQRAALLGYLGLADADVVPETVRNAKVPSLAALMFCLPTYQYR